MVKFNKVFIFILLIVLFIVLFSNLNKNKFTNLIKFDGDINSLKFYIINLEDERGLERRNHVKKVMDEANMPYEFFKAYDKDKIEDLKSSRYIKREHKALSNGEIALSMTHNELYKKLLSSSDSMLLIGEDDITIKLNFKFYLNQVLNNLPDDFDYISLEYIQPYELNSKSSHQLDNADDVPSAIDNSKIINYDTILKPGAAAYIVSRKGAEYFLKLNEPIWLPADGIKDPYWQLKYNTNPAKIYYVIPRLAFQSNLKQIK